MLRVALLSIFTLAAAPQQGFNAQGMPSKPAPQPLDEVLMQVFDKDMSKSVSEKEVLTTLDSFAEMSGMGAPPQPGAPPNQMEVMIKAAKRLAPSIFRILDANDSKGLSASELKWVAKAQKAFNSGDMRNLTRDVFDTVDTDHDDSLSADEMQAAADVDGPVLGQVVGLVHGVFPVRKDADELKALLLDLVSTAGAGMADGVALVDTDGDGAISRKEAGKAFSAAKKAFTGATRTLQEMGPMLAMFGGMGGMGGNVPGGMGGMPGGGGGRGRGRGR